MRKIFGAFIIFILVILVQTVITSIIEPKAIIASNTLQEEQTKVAQTMESVSVTAIVDSSISMIVMSSGQVKGETTIATNSETGLHLSTLNTDKTQEKLSSAPHPTEISNMTIPEETEELFCTTNF